MSTKPDDRPPETATAVALERGRATLELIAAEPFLEGLAGDTLPTPCLGAWLREDRHFVISLRRGLGRLIESAPDEATVDIVTGAFPAIRSELDRFEAEIDRRGLNIAMPPAPITKRFNAALLESFSAGPGQGLSAYWAAEHAYWWAWSRVRERVGAEGPYAAWIDNWASEEFAAFVATLADLTDAHAEPETTAAIAADVFEHELALWRYLWAVGTGPPAI